MNVFHRGRTGRKWERNNGRRKIGDIGGRENAVVKDGYGGHCMIETELWTTL